MKNTSRTLSFDDMVDALASEQRRRLLVALMDHNPQNDSPVDVRGDEIAAVEQLVEMQHVHLPKLDEYGFIDWEPENNEVVKGPKFDEIRPLLELLDDHADELPPDWT